MTNEEGEYLNYRIRTRGTTAGRNGNYDDNDLSPIFYNPNGQYAESNTQSHAYVPHTSTDNTSYSGYQNIQPTTVDSDPDLQSALAGEGDTNNEDPRDLNLNGTSWDGMQSGAIKHDSTQPPDWLSTVPE